MREGLSGRCRSTSAHGDVAQAATQRGRARACVAGLAMACMLSAGSGADDNRFQPAFTLRQITQIRTLGHFASSPDGARVAYTIAGYYYGFPVIPRFGEENNIRVVSIDSGEVRQVTSGSAPKTRPVFSPDAASIAFESEDDIWAVCLDSGSVRRVTTNGARDRDATWSPDGRQIAFVSSRGGQTNLWVASVEGEQYGLRQITNDALAQSDPQWSPDGRMILFTGKRGDEWYSQGVFTVPADGGASRRLTPEDGFDHSTGRWSPDGHRVAFLSDRNGYVRVWVMNADGSGAREFDTGPHDAMSPHWVVQPVWSPDGSRLLISINREGSYDLVALTLSTLSAEVLGTGGGQYHAAGWTPGGGVIYAYENAWSPPDLYVRHAAASAPRQLTFSSHVAFRREHFATMRRVAFRSSDGLEIRGFLVAPPDMRPGERLPAIVNLHPNGYGQFYDYWDPFIHYLARSGYVMLLVDQRGSSGYGRAFREAQIGAWGTKTAEDVKAAARFIKAQPFVDPDRVGVMGLSFGGYQALLALTKTPDLFRAGVDMMGPTDRRGTFTDRYRAYQIGATEKEDPERYVRISPITSVKDMTAPLLIIHSDQDRNVAPEFTYRLVAELERHRKRFDLKIYPGEAHGLADPDHQLDSYERIVTFFETHLARTLGSRTTR